MKSACDPSAWYRARPNEHRAKFARAIVSLLSLAGLALVQTRQVRAQQSDDLDQQVKQLRQQYEREIRDLQQRLAALELKVSDRKAAEQKAAEQKVSADTLDAPPATGSHSVVAEEVAQAVAKPIEGNKDQNEKRLQEQTTTDTTYVQLRDAENKIQELEQKAKTFEFHGYLRSGYGLNGLGGQQVALKLRAPAQNFAWEMKPKPTPSSSLLTTSSILTTIPAERG